MQGRVDSILREAFMVSPPQWGRGGGLARTRVLTQTPSEAETGTICPRAQCWQTLWQNRCEQRYDLFLPVPSHLARDATYPQCELGRSREQVEAPPHSEKGELQGPPGQEELT